MKQLSLKTAAQLILESHGRIFGVTFVKKDGSIRDMRCRLGVTKDLKGKGLSFDPSQYDLLPVYDMDKKSYRMIRLNTIQELRFDSNRYKVGA
jgi:hypothetical protein